MNYALWIMNYYCPQIYTDFHGFIISQPDRVIMNYALWIMNYYRPQIAQILKIYDSFRFKVQGYTLRVEI